MATEDPTPQGPPTEDSPQRPPEWYAAAEAEERAAEAEHESTQDRQQDLLGQGAYFTLRHLSRQPGGWSDPDLQDARRVIAALRPDGGFSFADLDPGAPGPPPPAPAAERPFAVWNGVNLTGDLESIIGRVHALTPPGDWSVEWFPKAGEGGSWQSALSDPRGLSGPAMLAAWVARGLALGARVAPYVVVRGRPEWNAIEWEQIGACAAEAGKVVLNLEPPGGGRFYWNGPTTPAYIQQYCDGFREAMQRHGAASADVSLCYIPRRGQVDELGGDAALRVWIRNVTMASGECYEDAPAPALAPGYAIPNIMARYSEDPRKLIPCVQRSMIGRYADSAWAAAGMEVWHLDGNI